MKSNYEKSLQLVLRHEGGYVNHPKDPGGATNKGVTQKVYDNYRSVNGWKKQSVRQITQSEVAAIYRHEYADVVGFDKLPLGLDYVQFDGGINSGPVQATKWLQRALGSAYTGKIDGVIGKLTLKAVNGADIEALINKILDIRLNFLKALKTWPTFGKGWAKRVADVRATAIAMARANPLPEQKGGSEGGAKATIEDAKKAPSKAAADMLTGGGTVGAVLSQSIEQLTPISSVEFVANIIAGLTVISVCVTIGGIAYRKWASTKAEELKQALGT